MDCICPEMISRDLMVDLEQRWRKSNNQEQSSIKLLWCFLPTRKAKIKQLILKTESEVTE